MDGGNPARERDRSAAAGSRVGHSSGVWILDVRGAIAGALKKKLGLDLISEKVEGRGRVYQIA